MPQFSWRATNAACSSPESGARPFAFFFARGRAAPSTASAIPAVTRRTLFSTWHTRARRFTPDSRDGGRAEIGICLIDSTG